MANFTICHLLVFTDSLNLLTKFDDSALHLLKLEG